MTNGTNSEHFIESYGVRTGLKREFTFAMKTQSQICDSIGRTRSKRAQNLVQVSTNSSDNQCKKSGLSKTENLRSLVKTKEDISVALSEKEVKSDMMDAKELKSQVNDETTMSVICEREHMSDEPKSQVENEGVMVVVCDKQHKNDGLKTEVGQMQPVCHNDKVKVESDNNENASILGSHLKTSTKSIQSTLERLENDDSKGKSNGVEKKRKSGSMIVSSTSKTFSMEKKFPSKLKDLLSSGILEGLLVKYVRSIKVLFYSTFI